MDRVSQSSIEFRCALSVDDEEKRYVLQRQSGVWVKMPAPMTGAVTGPAIRSTVHAAMAAPLCSGWNVSEISEAGTV